MATTDMHVSHKPYVFMILYRSHKLLFWEPPPHIIGPNTRQIEVPKGHSKDLCPKGQKEEL